MTMVLDPAIRIVAPDSQVFVLHPGEGKKFMKDFADTNAVFLDLAHINASIRMFEAPMPGEEFPLHMNLGRLFKGRELGQLCREALAEGPMDTRELAKYVIAAKGLDVGDKPLRQSVALRIVNAMTQAEKRRSYVERDGKNANVIRWRLRAP